MSGSDLSALSPEVCELTISKMVQQNEWQNLFESAILSCPKVAIPILLDLGRRGWQSEDGVQNTAFNKLLLLAQKYTESVSAQNKRQTYSILECFGIVEQLAFSPDGRFIVISSIKDDDSNQVQLWQFSPWKLVSSLALDFLPTSLSFSSDGTLVVASRYQCLAILSAPNLEIQATLGPLGRGPISTAFCPRGHYVCSGGLDGMFRIWDLKEPVANFKEKTIADAQGLVRCDHLGTYCAMATQNGNMTIWNLPEGRISKELNMGTKVIDFDFASGAPILVTAGALNGKYVLTFWNTSTWDKSEEANLAVDQVVSCKTRNLMATVSSLPMTSIPFEQTVANLNPHKFNIWNPITGKRIAKIVTGEEDWARSVAISPDGLYLAGIGNAKGIVLWAGGEGAQKTNFHELGDLELISSSALSRVMEKSLRSVYQNEWLPCSLANLIDFQIFKVNYLKTRTDNSLNKNSSGDGLTCFHCSVPVSDISRFCFSCGKSAIGFLPVKTVQCIICMRFITQNSKFCNHCGAAANEAPEKNKKTRVTKGSCQICGVLVSLDKNLLVKGHELTGTWKFLKGNCSGTGHKPFENDNHIASAFLSDLDNDIRVSSEQIESILQQKSRTFKRPDLPETVANSSQFTLTESNKHIWKFETRCDDLNEAIKAYNAFEAYPLRRDLLEKRMYKQWQDVRLKSWKMCELIGGAAGEEVKRAKQKRANAIKLAKDFVRAQDSKENKGALYSNDFLIGSDWQYEIFTRSRRAAYYIAERAFLTKRSAIAFSFGLVSKGRLRRVEKFDQFLSSFNEYKFAIPLIQCPECSEEIHDHFGELSCVRSSSQIDFDSEILIKALALGARAFRRGDPVLHAHVDTWYDFHTWADLFEVITNKVNFSCSLFCFTCKSELNFEGVALLCDCGKRQERIIFSGELDSKNLSQQIDHEYTKFFSSKSETSQFISEKIGVNPVADFETDDDDIKESHDLFADSFMQESTDLRCRVPVTLEEFENWVANLFYCRNPENILDF